ncbi:signal peptidase I [Patescibacteria group bacterium]
MKVLKVMSKVFYWTIIALLAVMVVLVVLSQSQKAIGGIYLFLVKSGSMEPIIQTGSLVAVKKQSDYEEGEIVTFKGTSNESKRLDDFYTTHRILEVIENEGDVVYKTKGDANTGEDKDTTLRSNVLGEVVFTIPYLGYAVNFAKSKTGIVILVFNDL